jgi:hypothetical protein
MSYAPSEGNRNRRRFSHNIKNNSPVYPYVNFMACPISLISFTENKTYFWYGKVVRVLNPKTYGGVEV